MTQNVATGVFFPFLFEDKNLLAIHGLIKKGRPDMKDETKGSKRKTTRKKA